MDALNDAVNLREVRIPELWAVSDMHVLEVLVQPGERIARNTPLLVLEPEKSTLDAPARSGPVEPWDPPGELRMKAAKSDDDRHCTQERRTRSRNACRRGFVSLARWTRLRVLRAALSAIGLNNTPGI